jgi:hypothetical protein
MCTTSGLIRRGSVATPEEIIHRLPMCVSLLLSAATGVPPLFTGFTFCYAR